MNFIPDEERLRTVKLWLRACVDREFGGLIDHCIGISPIGGLPSNRLPLCIILWRRKARRGKANLTPKSHVHVKALWPWMELLVHQIAYVIRIPVSIIHINHSEFCRYFIEILLLVESTNPLKQHISIFNSKVFIKYYKMSSLFQLSFFWII